MYQIWKCDNRVFNLQHHRAKTMILLLARLISKHLGKVTFFKAMNPRNGFQVHQWKMGWTCRFWNSSPPSGHSRVPRFQLEIFHFGRITWKLTMVTGSGSLFCLLVVIIQIGDMISLSLNLQGFLEFVCLGTGCEAMPWNPCYKESVTSSYTHGSLRASVDSFLRRPVMERASSSKLGLLKKSDREFYSRRPRMH